MEARLLSLYPHLKKYVGVTIFGHTSRGIPGVEVVGLGSSNRILKEKLIYINRLYNVELPLRRYTICVENFYRESGRERHQVEWLELSLLVVYWKLAKRLSLSNMENCFCSGRLSTGGTIESLALEQSFLKGLNSKLMGNGRKLSYLSTGRPLGVENIFPINLAQLMAPMPVVERKV